jgi:hypothetical protein
MQFFSLLAKPAGLWITLILFTPGVLYFDWLLLESLYYQSRATEYPTATAKITRSDVVEHRGSKGSRSYSLIIAYMFMVEGHPYAATRVRYYAGSNSRRQTVAELAKQFPVGATAVAYYPPDNPSDAILLPGIEGLDCLRLLLASASTTLLAGGWGLLLGRRPPFDPSNPAWLAETDNGWRVTLPGVTHRAVFIVAFAGTAFFAWFAINLTEGDNPDPLVVGAAFAGCMAIAALASVMFAHERFLEADLSARELVLPAPWLGEAARVPFDGVASVRVQSEERSAGKNGTYEVFHCDLGWGAGGRVEITTLATFLEREQAERLAMWVKLNCGLADRESTSIT